MLGIARHDSLTESAASKKFSLMCSTKSRTESINSERTVAAYIQLNRHSYYTMLYVCAFEVAEAFGYGTGASMELAMLIASPTLAYFGFRTFDKFSKQGASN